MTDLHSVHADRLMEAETIDPVERTLAMLPSGGDPPMTQRENAALEMAEAIHEHLRDGHDLVELRVTVATRDQWDDKDGVHITGWHKRQEFRSAGDLVAAIDWMTDDPWKGH